MTTQNIMFLQTEENYLTGKITRLVAEKKEGGYELIKIGKRRLNRLLRYFPYEHIKEVKGSSVTSMYTSMVE